LFGVDPGIDRWLAMWAAVPGPGTTSFRVASAATVAFGCAGGSLALSRFERHRFAATVLASITGAIAVFALLGYLTGIDTLHGPVSVNSPPLPSAVGLLCVAVGIILRIGTMPALRKSRPLWHLQVMLGCAIIAPLLPEPTDVIYLTENDATRLGLAVAIVPGPVTASSHLPCASEGTEETEGGEIIVTALALPACRVK
jgi:hypothetical protein